MRIYQIHLSNAPNVIKRQMFTLVYVLLFRYVILTYDESHALDMEPLIIDIRIPNVDICQQIKSTDCNNLIQQMLKCQQIIFNDPGFSYQQYEENINIFRQILAQYQTICTNTQNDYLINNLYDFQKN